MRHLFGAEEAQLEAFLTAAPAAKWSDLLTRRFASGEQLSLPTEQELGSASEPVRTLQRKCSCPFQESNHYFLLVYSTKRGLGWRGG
jgi:hypothetical protein